MREIECIAPTTFWTSGHVWRNPILKRIHR